MIQKGGMHCSVVMMEQPFFSPSQIRPFLLSACSSFSSPSDNIPCSSSGHKVKIHDELCPHNKKNTVSITFALDQTCQALQGVGDIFETQSKDWAFVLAS